MAQNIAINKEEQISELKSLRKDYKQKGAIEDFEFLGPKVPDATEDNPTRMKIHIRSLSIVVLVELPSTYPTESPPTFKVELEQEEEKTNEAEVVQTIHLQAIEELLMEQTTYMPGMCCIGTCLMVLDDLDISTLDLGTPGRYRSIFEVSVVNNSKQFVKSLKSAANGNPCIYLYRTIECQNNAKFSFAVDPWRATYCICDTPNKKESISFMKTIRTDNAMDMDMLGKPGKIQITVIEEFELLPKAKSIDCKDGGDFYGTEYRTDKDLDTLMNHLLAASAGV